MVDEVSVITMRVIDMANPLPGTWTIPCDECRELTWISSIWKNKKIHHVVCKPCWLSKYKNKEHNACVTEETIQQALKKLKKMGIYATREELLEKLEREIEKELKVE